MSAAIDAARADDSLSPLDLPAGVRRAGMSASVRQPLAGWLFGAAALMLALDLVIALALIGRMPRWPRRGGAGAGLVALALLAIPDASAQSGQDPTLAIRLAYVRTGDARVDRQSAQGLEALSEVLAARTSGEPGPPVGVDLARDDLSAFPFLYWPAPSNPSRLSDAALGNVNRYLAVGGLLLVDTRQAGGGAEGQRPAAAMLQGVDAPPLEQVSNQHVLGRAFYLMRAFPGRTANPQLWAETPGAAQARDGVAALFIGDGDWAAAWAGEAGIGARQRELSLRFGVNLVMVALTGNYKADQVHVPALLERMGRER